MDPARNFTVAFVLGMNFPFPFPSTTSPAFITGNGVLRYVFHHTDHVLDGAQSNYYAVDNQLPEGHTWTIDRSLIQVYGMTPQQVSIALRQIADSIEVSGKPSRAAVASSIQKVLESVHTAGKLTKFVERENHAAVHGIQQLMERLSKVAKTLNPQDPAKADVDSAIERLKSVEVSVGQILSALEDIDI